MPLNLGLVGAGGAKGASDALTEILKRRFLEDQERHRVENESRQRDIEQERNALYAQTSADEQASRAGIERERLGIARDTLAAKETEAATKRQEKGAQLVKLRAASQDESLPPPVRLWARLQADGLEGVGSVKDFQETVHTPTAEEQSRAIYAASIGKKPEDLTYDDLRKRDQQHTEDTQRAPNPLIFATPEGLAQITRGATPTATPVTRPGGAPVMPFSPPVVAQGSTGLVSVDRPSATAKPITDVGGKQVQPPPVVVAGPTGPQMVNRVEGTATPVTDKAGAPLGRPVPPGLMDDLAQVEIGYHNLETLRRTKKQDWIGPAQGYLTKAQIAIPGLDVDPDLAEFDAATTQLQNATIRMITGAQMNKDEARRILGQVPGFYDKDVEWEAKYRQTLQNLQIMQKKMQAMIGPGALPGSQPPPTGSGRGGAVVRDPKTNKLVPAGGRGGI
jgi:hypothetical protein